MTISNPMTDRSPAETRRELRRSAQLSLLLAVLWLGGVGSVLAVRQGRRALDGLERHHQHRRTALCGYVAGWIGVGISALVLVALFVYISAAGYGMSVRFTYPS